ncbi:MAG TPA: ATPase [Sedimentibacter sp.]|jgi:vacuolar-type H+-ATPase subunit H|nr:ATPase [Sedimentibacter sp.]NLA14234.1 ATPase [Tissierellia bacterium]HAS92477.1 ATPase [Clostridiales bacterium]HOA19020.1 ATPase [Sedimentibacter sp.]HOG62022.1 ATPase [Sedimentibacter sp.]
MDILNLLERIEDIIEDSSKFPLSNKVMIDKEEVLEVINEIRLKLPDEINRASWVAKERQRILNEAQSEADELINKVKEQQKHLIEESEITRQAKIYANEIIEEAERKANEMKVGAYNYSDEILSKLQDKIKEINNIIEDNREVLKKM